MNAGQQPGGSKQPGCFRRFWIRAAKIIAAAIIVQLSHAYSISTQVTQVR